MFLVLVDSGPAIYTQRVGGVTLESAHSMLVPSTTCGTSFFFSHYLFGRIPLAGVC